MTLSDCAGAAAAGGGEEVRRGVLAMSEGGDGWWERGTKTIRAGVNDALLLSLSLSLSYTTTSRRRGKNINQNLLYEKIYVILG